MALEDRTVHRDGAKPRPIAQRVGADSSVDAKPQDPLWEQSIAPFHGGGTARGPDETTSTTPPPECVQFLSTSRCEHR